MVWDGRGFTRSYLDRTDLFLTVATDAQSAAAAGMRPWEQLEFRGARSVAAMLASAKQPGAVVELHVSGNPEPFDVGELSAFGRLKSVGLIDCPSARGIGHLSELGLEELMIVRCPDLSGLQELDSLHLLSVAQRLPGRGSPSLCPFRPR